MRKFSTNLEPPSEEIVDGIFIHVFNYETKHKNKNGIDNFKNIDSLNFDDSFGAISYFEETIRFINSRLLLLYKTSLRDCFHFFDCPLEVYEKKYEERKNQFLSDYQNSTELDFLEEEKYVFRTPEKFRVLKSKHGEINYSKYLIHNVDFKIALDRKKEYINNRIKLFEKHKNYNSKVFRSLNAEEWFNETLEELNALNNKLEAGVKFQ